MSSPASVGRSGGLMIYIILAWVFESYIWPLAVMSIIPFGLVGAIFGHWLLGFDVTMMSIFGIFGLLGIVINDSIILTVAFKNLRAEGMPAKQAAVAASQKRLRAVLLTSLPTIVGILPLLFETALEAQFLKPMVISLSFGLLFGMAVKHPEHAGVGDVQGSVAIGLSHEGCRQ